MFTVARYISNSLTSTVILLALSACSHSNNVVQDRGNASTLSPILVSTSTNRQVNQAQSYSLLIHRSQKRLEVFDSQGKRVWNTTIGIGKGGLKPKKNMADLVTPTGEMTVDLILYRQPEYNRIAVNNVERFAKNNTFRPLVSNPQGLAKLYTNMNTLDFDGNGSPDKAYGDAYIGLASSKTITGPKMTNFQGIPYWFSIALHGTPQSENIGKANSGGCVHVDAKSLQQLIENGWVKLGTKVKIVD